MTEETVGGGLSNLLKALQAVMSEAIYVQKNGKNAFHNYKYATEADLVAAVRPAMIKNGLLLIGPVVEGDPTMDEYGNTNVALHYTLAHVSGEVWPEPLRIVGTGNDRAKNGTVGDKGTYKAYTGAVKYLLFKLLLIETGDDPEVTSNHDQASETPQSPRTPAPAQPANGTGPKIRLDQVNEIGDLWVGVVGTEAPARVAHLKMWTGKVKRGDLAADVADEYLVILRAQAKVREAQDAHHLTDADLEGLLGDNALPQDIGKLDAKTAERVVGLIEAFAQSGQTGQAVLTADAAKEIANAQ